MLLDKKGLQYVFLIQYFVDCVIPGIDYTMPLSPATSKTGAGSPEQGNGSALNTTEKRWVMYIDVKYRYDASFILFFAPHGEKCGG